MRHYKSILYLLAPALFLGASCTQTATNANTVTNTNTVNENANVEVVTNTNDSNVNSDVDTSDWLTYTNEEYGFSFKYPSDWTTTEKGKSANVYSSSKSAELKVDPMTSADLYISIDETSTGSIKDLYSDKTNYRLVQDNEDGVIIAYDQVNEFADSINTYYYIQSTDETKTLSATFFQNSLQSDIVVSIIQTINLNSEQASEVDTSDWLTYTNDEYGFSFRYPEEWDLKEVIESGLGTKPGDVRLSKDICQIHVDKPTPASTDIIEALTTKELRGSAVEVLSINDLNVIKQIGPVNTYGDIGDSYRILNDNSEVSLFVMQSGLDVTSCVEDYQDIMQTITRL